MNNDTYFLSSKEALKVAKQKNKVYASNAIVTATQICYYDGEELFDAPYNCINVEKNNFIDYFSNTKNRIPKNLNTDGLNLTTQEQEDQQTKFEIRIKEIDDILKNKIDLLKQKIKKQEPSFSDTKLRIYAHGCRETVLIKHIINNIANAFKKIDNIEILVHKQNTDLESCSEYHYLEKLYKFNPHAIVKINHIDNEYLNENVFNFVWFQDVMPIMKNDSKIYLRKRDFIFHLTKGLGRLLKEKNIDSSYQSFCIDTNLYKLRDNINRNKKIVFIGSSNFNNYDNLTHPRKEEIYKILLEKYLKNGVISLMERKLIGKEFKIDFHVHLGYIINYIERDVSLIHISKMNLDYELEIYGQGWQRYKELEAFYKGILSYGEDISKVYNEAEYSLVLGGYVLQQRTLESAASGCLPIVLDSRLNKGSENRTCFNESLLFVKKLDEIPLVLNRKQNKDLNCIVAENTYERFAEKMINIIKDATT